MQTTVRISSKRQMTIPSEIFESLGLKMGQELVVTVKDSQLILESQQAILDRLAGSVSLPDRFKNKDLDIVIQEATQEYFQNKYGA